jgi:hypothetical protein
MSIGAIGSIFVLVTIMGSLSKKLLLARNSQGQKIHVLVATLAFHFLLIACSFEANDPIQRERQQKLIALVQKQIGTASADKMKLIGLPISAAFCRARNPKVEQQDCLNIAVEAANAREADEQVNHVRSAISRICTSPGQCFQFGEGVVVLTGVWSDPPHSGNVTPYGLSSGEVRRRPEVVFFLRNGIWN